MMVFCLKVHWALTLLNENYPCISIHYNIFLSQSSQSYSIFSYSYKCSSFFFADRIRSRCVTWLLLLFRWSIHIQRDGKREPFYRIYRITYELFINMGYSFIYRFLLLVSFSPSLRRFCKCFLLLWAPLKPPNTVRVFNGYKIVLPALVLRDCFFYTCHKSKCAQRTRPSTTLTHILLIHKFK